MVRITSAGTLDLLQDGPLNFTTRDRPRQESHASQIVPGSVTKTRRVTPCRPRCREFLWTVELLILDMARIHPGSSGSTINGAVSCRCGIGIGFLPRKTKFIRHHVCAIIVAS